METNHEDRWVAGQLTALEPNWSPDYARGRTLLDAGLAKRTYPRSWIAATAASAAVCIIALAVPQTRALAQQLWYHLVLNRVDVVRLDLSDLPLHTRVTMNSPGQSARDLDDAEQKAGFRPYIPVGGTLNANPKISVIGMIALDQTVIVRDLEAALHKVGAGDLQVPPEWDGAHLRSEIGPMVAADYPDDTQILQARPIALSIPSGFPLERFAEVAFRSIGVSIWESRALAQKFVANPAWLLDIPADEAVHIQQISLRTGPALLIEDFDDNGNIERVTIIRSASNRIYSVSARNRGISLQVADALP